MKRYFRLVQFNEMMMGQTFEYISTTNREFEFDFNIDYGNLYICITGLEKRVYTPHLNITTGVYVDAERIFYTQITSYLKEEGCLVEQAMMIYSPNKQLCVLFSPTEDCTKRPFDLAEEIHGRLQSIFDETILSGISRVENFTALSPKIQRYEEIGERYQETLALHQLSFFLMEGNVMTQEMYEERRRPWSFNEAYDFLHELMEACKNGDVVETLRRAEELFLVKLRYSFDFSLCVDVLAALKQRVSRLLEAYDLTPKEDLGQVFTLRGKMDIRDLHERCRSVLLKLTEEVLANGKRLSPLVQEALRYMKNNFHREISLGDIAGYVNLVPGYLSRIFRKEMDMSTLAYLSELRMQRARELLLESNLKVFEIAEAVGIPNSRHFGQVFKRAEGLTPQEYREQKWGSQRDIQGLTEEA